MKLLSLIPKLTKHVIQIRNWRSLWYHFIGKNTCAQWKNNRSTSFAIDNMCYVSFRIWEQECVPWCGEIKTEDQKFLGRLFNLHSNSTWCPRCVVSQSVSKERIKSVQHSHTKPFHSLYDLKWKTLWKSLMKTFYENPLMKFCMFLSLYITNYLIGLAFWAISIGL